MTNKRRCDCEADRSQIHVASSKLLQEQEEIINIDFRIEQDIKSKVRAKLNKITREHFIQKIQLTFYYQYIFKHVSDDSENDTHRSRGV